MWTYMMAASRGERANSMMSSRRRSEHESPKYGYSLRPLYRSTRSNVPSSSHTATTSLGSSYPPSSSYNQYDSGAAASSAHAARHANKPASAPSGQGRMFHTKAASQHRVPAARYGTSPIAATESTIIPMEEDGTSLFSPLTPRGNEQDFGFLHGNDGSSSSTTMRMVRKHLIANHAAVSRDDDDDDEDDDYDDGPEGAGFRGGKQLHRIATDSEDDDSVALSSRGAQQGHHRTAMALRNSKRRAYVLHDRAHSGEVIARSQRRNDDDAKAKGTANGEEDVEEDEDPDEDDDEEGDDHEADKLESSMEQGKPKAHRACAQALNQDQTKRSKPSALRRTLTALRHRLTRRSRSKPPDWFLEKFSNSGSNSANFERYGKAAAELAEQPANSKQNSEIRGSSTFCNRLSVDPTLQSHYRWLGVVSLAVLYNIIFVVGRSVFWEINQRATPVWYFLDYLCDFIYIVDTLVHMHEGYLDQGLLVRDACKLRRHYFTTKGWSIDVLSMLPTDLAYIWWSPNLCSSTFLPCAVIVRLNRLLRLPRLMEWFDRTETATSYPNAFRICKVVLAILVLIHWNACLYFAISYALGFGTDNWVYNLNGYRNSTLQRQYIYSFYWSTLTLTTIGETPIPENDPEYLFVVADFLAGVLIFATIVGNIGSMISNMNVARVEFQNRMDGVKQYMAFRKVGHELEARVIRWFAYTWSQSGALDEERVLAALPDKLKAEIAIQVHMDTLKQVRIFHDCEPGLLEALVLKLKLQVFSPGDYICRKGDVGKEMYIVKRGKLSVVADDGMTVFATLGAGSVFGEVSVLEIAGNRTGNRRTANVRSLGYSDLFCLAKRDLWETLGDYPEARATLTERGCQLLRKDGLLDEQIFADSQRVQDSIESGMEKLEVSVENLNVRLARLLAEYTASQAKLKQRIAKLEMSHQLANTTTAGMPVDTDQIRPRSGRLYSLQPKRRPRPRPAKALAKNSGDDNSKQNTL